MIGIVIASSSLFVTGTSYCLVVIAGLVISSSIVIAEVIGASLLLVAFVGQSLGRWGEDAPSFLLLNAIGAGLLAATAWTQGALGFAVLNTVWCLVALRALGSWSRAVR